MALVRIVQDSCTSQHSYNNYVCRRIMARRTPAIPPPHLKKKDLNESCFLLFWPSLFLCGLEESVGKSDVVDVVHGGIVQHVRIQEKKYWHVDLLARS